MAGQALAGVEVRARKFFYFVVFPNPPISPGLPSLPSFWESFPTSMSVHFLLSTTLLNSLSPFWCRRCYPVIRKVKLFGMKTTRLIVGLLVSCGSGFAAAAEGDGRLRVLPYEVDGRAAGNLVYDHLAKIATEQLAKRAKGMETVVKREAIERRQAYVRQAIIDSFHGFPERTPLNPEIVGTLHRDNYSIEKIIFESRPGFHVTAVLYLPNDRKGKVPGVLVPCGHSQVGKAEEAYQRACILMARNGLAVLCYDPISQGERMQTLGDDGQILIPSSTEEHTNIGIGALLVGSNTAMIRVWDGMRCIDYLQSRPEIDGARIGVTGNSGGGTLSSYLMCLDGRIAAAAPSCYITSFQRLIETIGPQDAEQNFTGFIAAGLDMADFVEAMAPKPVLLCTATNDFFDIQGSWDTFREAKRFYGRLGFSERVDLIEFEDQHGFSMPRRVAAARWMRRWLLDAHEAITEPDFAVFKTEELQCSASGQIVHDRKRQTAYDLIAETEDGLAPKRQAAFDSADGGEWRKRVAQLIGAVDDPQPGPLQTVGNFTRPTCRYERILFKVGDLPIPGLLFMPKDESTDRLGGVVYVHGGGMAHDAGEGGPIEELAAGGYVILAIDPPGYGELAQTPQSTGGHERRFGSDWKTQFLAFHVGKTLVGMGTDAIRASGEILRRRDEVDPEKISLIGIGDGGVLALHAGAIDARFAAVVTKGAVHSYSAIAKSESSSQMLNLVVPGALRVYDLPLLTRSIGSRPVRHLLPADPMRQPFLRPPGGTDIRFTSILGAMLK